ncbi:glycosyl transferase [Microbacterium sp. dk485]|uniref:glycosyltransferase n=1 Tax=Microbacterium sp. dk485 TaxID=2560021 RepID=UPI0010739CF9|nr:glycosyltransferase [Microbacterium sp. dk485]TFV83794.1 glycosyl transferase [Microbacterium sp. dk485]
MTKPHLLYTAWGFPPSRAGGVYRAVATVNAFAAAGWDVTVLTVPRELWLGSTGIDADLEQRVDPSVRIVRHPAPVPAYQNDVTAWPAMRARHPEWWKLADLWRDYRFFPEPNYGRLRPILESAAERIHRDRPVDIAVGTANPHVDFVPGWHLSRRYGVPYVMDYRDAWQLDVFSGKRLLTATPGVRRWEAKLLAGAREVWFVNDAIREWHASQHPGSAERMRVVANGYDEYAEPLAVPVRPSRDRGLVFGYVGTVTEKVPIPALLAGWRIARREDPSLAGARLRIHGYLGHFGAVDAALARLLEDARADGVSYEGPVSKAAIAGTYAGFDALVLALGTGRYVTSGKVYEYAATGMPIAAVHDPGNAATDVLSASPVWTPTRSLSPEDIAIALRRTASLALTQTSEERLAAQEWGRRYERSAQLAPRIAALRPAAP